MSDGRLTRLAILAVLLLAPLAAAAPPSPRHSSPDAMDGQDITDLAMEGSGQFAASVVAHDAARLNLGGLSQDHDDVYLCDFGSTAQPTAGAGCRGIDHVDDVQDSTQAPNAPQRVDATRDGSGQGVYAVAGPGAWISAWRSTSNTPTWTVETEDEIPATNVTLAADGSRAVFATTPSSPTSSGRIEVRNMANGQLLWDLTLTSDTGNVRPTSLDYARSGGILAIGTTSGLFVTDASTNTAPTGALGGITQVERVNRVITSADGKYVVAAASNGVFLGTITRDGAKPIVQPSSVFNRGFTSEVQDVAFALDGSRFAAASGNTLHFYRRLDTSQLAEPLGSQTLPSTITSIAYDQEGQLLVALAGTMVYGFGPAKLTPIWSFDASQTAFGALDGPLREVVVSDDAQRIAVAGKTKTMAYNSILGVTATLASTNATTSIAPTQTLNLTLTVKNTGSLADNYSFSVLAPFGAWQTTSLDSVRLDPNETATLPLSVTAPPGGEPGVYGVQVRLRSALAEERNPAVGFVASPAFNITIPRSVVLKVEAPDDRLLLRQGGEQTVSVTIRNEGNARGLVNMTARQELTRGATWDIRFVPEQIEVPAAGSATVSMIVTAPSDAGSGDRNIVTIRAREGETAEATDQVTAYVDAQFGAELKTNLTAWEFYPGQVQTLRLNVSNIGNTEDTYNLTYSITPSTVESDWRVTIESPQVTIARGQTKQIGVTVKAVASDAREAALTLRSISQSSPDREENTLVLSLVTVPRPPTDEDKDSFLRGPSPALVVLAVALLALARFGGRR